jgi:hypothetical protein
MKPRVLFLLPVILSLFLCSCRNQPPKDIFQQVITKAGLPANKKLLVVVFINPECPITQKYTRTLNALNDSLGENTFFIGVIPGNLFDDKKIADFKEQFAFKLPIIKDEQYAITRALNATVYPEVVLLNQQSERLYSGKIDNWYESVGNYRTEPTEFYLRDAIGSYLQKGIIAVNSTTPVGCFINYKNN